LLSKHAQSRLVRLFIVFIVELALWSIFYHGWTFSRTSAAAEWWVRTVMIFVSIMPATFMQFVAELTRRSWPGWVHVLNHGVGIFFATQVYTSQFAPYGAPGFLFFPVWPYGGPLCFAGFLHFAGNFLGAQWVMYRVLRVETGVLRQKIAAVFWGNFLGVVTGATNWLPWFRHIVPMFEHIPPIFPPFISLLVVVYGWASVRHQLMDIEVVIKRTLVFAGLVGSVVAVVSFVAFVSQDLLASFVEIPKWLSNVLSAAIIAAVYGPVHRWLINVTEKHLFQKKYDYKELLMKFSDDVMVMVDLRDLLNKTVTTMTETVKLENCSVLLLNKGVKNEYELAASRGGNIKIEPLDEQEPFITFLRETHEPIGQDGTLARVHFPEQVTDCLKHLQARLCLPLHVHEDLIGVLCLGKKKSDEEFTKDDLDILMPLSRTLGIAVSNARLFEELVRTQAEAAQKEKLAVIGTLSAGINHEICNPLGIVKAQTEAFMLDEEDGLLKGRTPEELLERVSNIFRVTLKQIERATAITQKLSNFAKPIKAAAMEPVSVEHEVDEVILLVGHDLKLEKIAVHKEIAGDLPKIVVDRRQLQEVLFNLIRNAGQAIKPPGTITVRARESGGDVRIEIEDTGSGIPADKLEKIYDPFFTTKEPGKGTGLGLFIVRQIVERNKGRISLESTVGKGTTFFLDFPAAQPVAAAV